MGLTILEEGNGIGLGFNLCVAPPQHYAGVYPTISEGCQRPESDRGWTEVEQRLDRSLSME